MFLFFGISPKTKHYGFVRQHCQVHGSESWMELVSQRSWFNLFFFLKLFPVGRGHHLLTCTDCGATYELDEHEAVAMARTARQDVDVPRRSGGMFGGFPFGGFFGGGSGYGAQGDRAYEQTYSTDPYPPGDNPYADPQVVEGEPVRVRSKRLDRGA